MNWQVIIVDDHQLVLEGLAYMIKTAPGFNLLATAGSGKALLEKLPQLSITPHIILMDIDMPSINGIDTAKLVKKSFPDVKILMLTMHEESIYYNKVIASRADGLIMKSATRAELLAALNTVCNGTSFFNETKNATSEASSLAPSEVSLTKRESEILRKIASGMSNAEISELLGISVRTVDTHRTNLKKKLKVNGIAGLVRYVYEQKLLT